jgi:hypothetical protein
MAVPDTASGNSAGFAALRAGYIVDSGGERFARRAASGMPTASVSER